MNTERITPEQAFAMFQQSILGKRVLSDTEYAALKQRSYEIVRHLMEQPLPRNLVHIVTPMRTIEDFRDTHDIRTALEAAGYAVFDPTIVEVDWMTKSDLDNLVINHARAALYNARRGIETHGSSSEVASYLRRGVPVIALVDTNNKQSEHMKRLLSAYPLSVIGEETLLRGYVGRSAHVVDSIETGLACLDAELTRTVSLTQRREQGRLNYYCNNCDSVVLRTDTPYTHTTTSRSVVREHRFHVAGGVAFAAQLALLVYSALTFQPLTYNDLPSDRQTLPLVANRFQPEQTEKFLVELKAYFCK